MAVGGPLFGNSSSRSASKVSLGMLTLLALQDIKGSGGGRTLKKEKLYEANTFNLKGM